MSHGQQHVGVGVAPLHLLHSTDENLRCKANIPQLPSMPLQYPLKTSGFDRLCLLAFQYIVPIIKTHVESLSNYNFEQYHNVPPWEIAEQMFFL